MNGRQNIAIACLTVSACILAALLIGTWATSPARADVGVRGGRYIAAAGQVTSSADYLYVLDMGNGLLNIYAVSSRLPLKFVGVVPLKQTFDRYKALQSKEE